MWHFFILRPRHQELATPPETSKPIAELEHGDGTGTTTIRSVAFSPDGQLLASGGSDGTIKLWDVNENKHIKLLEHRLNEELSEVSVVTFSPDSKWIASGEAHVKLWDITDILNPMEGTTFQHDSAVSAVDFSPDGELLAAGDGYLSGDGDQSGKVKVWDIQSEKAITLQHGAFVWTVDFSPDGKLLAAGDLKGKVKVWDILNKQVIQTLKVDSKLALVVKFSPDNRILVGAGIAGEVKLWTLPDWQLQGTLITGGTVTSLAFSPDGKVLATANNRRSMEKDTHITGDLNLWSMDSGAHIISLRGHTNKVNSVAFSPDGTILASGSEDAILRIWNVEPYMTPQQIDTRSEVKLIYFVPRDRTPKSDIGMKLDRLVRDVQGFYANEMERHGFGRKTFDFEKDENGYAVVYYVKGQSPDSNYLKDTFDKVIAEIDKRFTEFRNVYLVAVDISSERIGESGGRGGIRQFHSNNSNLVVGLEGGYALIPASGIGFSFHPMAHEIGHVFGLEHDFRKHDSFEGSDVMSYNRTPPYRLSKCAAEWLNKSRLFNHNQKFYNELPTIEKLPSLTNKSNLTHLRFKVEDADGLRQVQLAVPTTDKDRRAIVEYDLKANPMRKREIREIAESSVDALIKKKGDLAREDRDLLRKDMEDYIKSEEYIEDYIKGEANKPAFIEGARLKLLSCQLLNGKKTSTVEFELPDTSIKKVNLRIIDLLGNIAEQEFDLNTDTTEPSEKP